MRSRENRALRTARVELHLPARGEGILSLRELVPEGVAGGLGVAEEHGVVRLVEDWIVGASLSNTHRALQDHALLRLPDLRTDAVAELPRLSRETRRLSCRRVDGVEATRDA